MNGGKTLSNVTQSKRTRGAVSDSGGAGGGAWQCHRPAICTTGVGTKGHTSSDATHNTSLVRSNASGDDETSSKNPGRVLEFDKVLGKSHSEPSLATTKQCELIFEVPGLVQVLWSVMLKLNECRFELCCKFHAIPRFGRQFSLTRFLKWKSIS